MGGSYTRSNNAVDIEALAQALLKALGNPTVLSTLSKDTFDETFSYKSLAEAMVRNAPNTEDTSSNIKERAKQIKHKKDKAEVAEVLKTIKEQEK